VKGWLFDSYPLKDKMVFWIRNDEGHTVRLEDVWTPSIYVGADSSAELETLQNNPAVQHYTKSSRYVSKYERITDHAQGTVLELTLADSGKVQALANVIEDIDVHNNFRLYNVDILPPQAYFYYHDIFPLAKCNVHVLHKEGKLSWQLDDDKVTNTNYRLPDFRVAHLDLPLKQERRLPSFDDKIDAIDFRLHNETIEIRERSEEDSVKELMREVQKADPDFIFTADGDEFVFPYLIERAASNNIQLILGREPMPLPRPPKGGKTYFSYGRVHYRAASVMLHGRMHLDTSNSLIHDTNSIHGLCELARVCRIPLHTVSRSTIGRALTSMQFYLAHKRNLLVPYKPANLESVKTLRELIVADRGGLIIEPKIGVHEKVAEFDFVGLYPNIIRKLNIGAETLNCDCCPDSPRITPELGYRICEKRRGLVAESLEIPLDNRKQYKQLKKLATDDKTWTLFEARQAILRVIGHVSFGYQGHAHSHFGLIDVHCAICAWARYLALIARKTAESLDYSVLHLIIDSLFAKKQGSTYEQQYMKLKEAIEQATEFEISYEGEYKWLVFLPSKGNPMVGVPNRYFGCYEDGTIKDRGIETRRHDTPPLFSRFQREVLDIMAEGNTIAQVKALMPKVKEIFQKYKRQLQEGRVPIVDLIFTKMLSKDSEAYIVNTAEASAIHQLDDEGKSMRAGQVLQYIITDYYRKNRNRRTVPVELINEKTTYDSMRYMELLADVCNSVCEPFANSRISI
jgi:DNA polymerase I